MNNGVGGWIKLHRRTLESLIFSSEKGLKVWIWCLLKANHEDKEFFLGNEKVKITSGQFITGFNAAREELSLARGTIWLWLKKLEEIGNIERKVTNKYSVITVRNWSEYQNTERRSDADRTQNETNKNVKNEKNINTLGFHPQNFGFSSISETLKNNLEKKSQEVKKTNGLHTAWQDKAFRYADSLHIVLGEKDKGRWLSIFKKASEDRQTSKKIDTAYSYLVDYTPFRALQGEHRINYFFQIFNRGIGFSTGNINLKLLFFVCLFLLCLLFIFKNKKNNSSCGGYSESTFALARSSSSRIEHFCIKNFRNKYGK